MNSTDNRPGAAKPVAPASEAPRPVLADNSPSEPASGTATVAVALKLPQGLVLHYFEEQEEVESVPSGYRTITKQVRVGEPFILRGNVHTHELELQGVLPDQNGYVITPGVPKDLWDQWYRQNADPEHNGRNASLLIKNELIHAEATEQSALAWARDPARRLIRSGLERVDPAHPELYSGPPACRNVTAIQVGVGVRAP
jgi:hypothetical protein